MSCVTCCGSGLGLVSILGLPVGAERARGGCRDVGVRGCAAAVPDTGDGGVEVAQAAETWGGGEGGETEKEILKIA